MIAKPLGAWIWRCSAETTPVVSVRSRPKGLPIAIVGSPTWTSLEEPSGSALRLSPSGSTLSSARSVDGSLPTILALTVFLSANWTVTESGVAPSITWLLVRMSPLASMTKPEPVASLRCAPPNGSNGFWVCWVISERTKTTPGA